MALIKCPECGRQFSDYSPNCPKCGMPTNIIKQRIGAPLSKPVPQQAPQPVPQPQPAPQPRPQPKPQPVAQPQPVPQPQPAPQPKPQSEPQPKPQPVITPDPPEPEWEDEPKFGFKRLAIIVAGIAVLVGVIFAIRAFTSAGGGNGDAVDSVAATADTAAVDKAAADIHIVYNATYGACEYVGETDSKGRPHGQGKAAFEDGSRYEGSFKAGKLDGEGTYYQSDGTYFKGTFKDDEPTMVGAWYNADGTKQ